VCNERAQIANDEENRKTKSQTALEKFEMQISRHSFKWAGERFGRERETVGG
jgi:hypothetical protein